MTEIEQICDVNPQTNIDKIPTTKRVAFVPMAAVSELSGQINLETRRPLSSVAKGFTRFRTGDVIFAKITPCMENGKIAVLPDVPFGIAFGSTEFHVLRPCKGIDPRYVFYYLIQDRFRSNARRSMTGAVGQQRVPKEFMKRASMPIAPSRQQQRIVAKIDELFGEIEAGEQELEKAREGLEAYRRSLLKAAVTGELTRDWRKKNPPKGSGADFLKRILAERRAMWERRTIQKLKAKGRKPKDGTWKSHYIEPESPNPAGLPKLPLGWVWASLDQLLTSIDAGLNFKCDGRPPSAAQIGVVKISAVTWGEFDENESKTIIDASRFIEDAKIEKGDFLFSRANTLELVGSPAIVRRITKTLALSDKVLRFRFAAPIEEWVCHLLRTPWGRHEIQSHATGNQLSMRNITQRNIRKIRVPLPPPEELKELERRLADYARTVADAGLALSASLEDAARALESVLTAAFSGKLVPQDPSDEPASVLLERLRATRAEVSNSQKRPSRKVAAGPVVRSKRSRRPIAEGIAK